MCVVTGSFMMFVFLSTCQWPTRYELFVFLEMAVHCNCRPLLGVVVVVVVGPGAGVGGQPYVRL